MKWFHRLDVFSRLFCRFIIRIIKFLVLEQFLLSRLVGCADRSVSDGSADGFHHCHVLEIIVRLEQCVACAEFNKDAANGPNIAGETPATTCC